MTAAARRIALAITVAATMVLVLPAAGMAHKERAHRHHHPRQQRHHRGTARLSEIKHVVVVYEENHSFDNLFGGWERVRGLKSADAAHSRQVSQSGVPFGCLKQDDVNLTLPPLSARCTDTTTGTAFSSHFSNHPFRIDTPALIPPDATTCPKPGDSPPNGALRGPATRAAAPATSCTATTRSSTSSTAASRTATPLAATPSA